MVILNAIKLPCAPLTLGDSVRPCVSWLLKQELSCVFYPVKYAGAARFIKSQF